MPAPESDLEETSSGRVRVRRRQSQGCGEDDWSMSPKARSEGTWQKPRPVSPGPQSLQGRSESCWGPWNVPPLLRVSLAVWGRRYWRGRAFTQLCTNYFLSSPQGAGGFKVPSARQTPARAKAKPERSLSLELGWSRRFQAGPGRSREDRVASCWLSGGAARPGLAWARRLMDRVSPLQPRLPRKPSSSGSLQHSRAWWALWLVQV